MPSAFDREIHKLLRLTEPEASEHIEHEKIAQHHEPEIQQPAEHFVLPDPIQLQNGSVAEAVLVPSRLKNILVYPVIFLVAFLFFYTAFNLPSLIDQVRGWFAAKSQAETILGEDSAEFYAWIGNYFYALGDNKLLDPNNDIDKDGLTNHDEFIMRTNPILADSDSDSFSDGIEVINSTNPWGEGNMTGSQKSLAKNLNQIMINNRISFDASSHNLIPIKSENFDLEKPAILSIPKLNLRVDLIWSKNPSEFETDLTKGVIHYPGTSWPRQSGIIYVSGHSSDYFWKHDPMHNIFSRINQLSAGDDIFIDVYGKDGKVYNYRYQVSGSHTFSPDDQAQFIENTGISKLNLSTCWPIGTQKDRLVVSAVAVGL